MTNNTDRDTHFQQFAQGVLKEMLAQRPHRQVNYIDFNADEADAIEEYSTIIARRAYDLVKHTLNNCTSGQDFDVIYHEDAIPDMLVLPEVKDE